MAGNSKSGGIVYCSLDSQFVDIAYLPDAGFFDSPWNTREEIVGQTMDNGWTRYNSGDAFDVEFQKEVLTRGGSGGAWLCQANYIFSCLQITLSYENYVFMGGIDFRLAISATTQTPPEGYLFLCPLEDFRVGPCSFWGANCPAYWSLDPSGGERLSMAEATQLGFPCIQLTTEIHGASWDASVYAGMRQFHQAKGFDPESQDVARHLKCRLFQLSNVVEVVEGRFAYGDLQLWLLRLISTDVAQWKTLWAREPILKVTKNFP
ncbi:hypothetical protein C8R44DRAFT_734862 [Mycena epipterygia]|nr:hypothetical protein C8R44DRAFT_734862 [Mycena epipterygia]